MYLHVVEAREGAFADDRSQSVSLPVPLCLLPCRRPDLALNEVETHCFGLSGSEYGSSLRTRLTVTCGMARRPTVAGALSFRHVMWPVLPG